MTLQIFKRRPQPVPVSGGWELIERKVIGSAVQNYDFVKAVAGDTDPAYKITASIQNDDAVVGTCLYQLRINGASVVCNRQRRNYTGSSLTGVYAQATSTFFMTLDEKDKNSDAPDGTSALDAGFAEIIIPNPSSAGIKRVIMARSTNESVGVDSIEMVDIFMGITTTPAGEFLAFGVGSTKALGLGIGTILSLYKETL